MRTSPEAPGEGRVSLQCAKVTVSEKKMDDEALPLGKEDLG